MLKRRHDFFLLRSFTRVRSCCQLSSSCRNYQMQSILVLSSFPVPVRRCVNCGNRPTIDQSNVFLCRLQPVTKRFYTALHHNLNVRTSMLPTLSSRVASLQWPVSVLPSFRLLPSVRSFTLSPKAIVEASPLYIQPYLRLIRLDRPIGTWLLFLPSAWSLTLATPVGQLPDPGLLMLFALGAFMMRSAGCTINDMWDKDFDIHVERTKDRPIACGEITRLKAFVFLGLPLSASLTILLSLNWNTVMLGFGAMIPVIVYPLMKRITYWPQAFLGITFNYGALMGWSAVRGCLDWSVLPLYLSCFAWTVVYDSIYAFQDKKYDSQIGVKSTALRFDEHPRLWMSGFASLMTSGLAATGWLCQQTWPYYLGVGLFAAHVGHQICTVHINDPKDCGKKFRSNRDIGLVFWALILASGAYSYRKGAKRDATDKYLADHDQISHF